jgi:hypothetical protein
MNWTWKLTAEIFGVTALVMGDAAAFWSANNPSLMTVRTFRRKGGKEAEHTARDIRVGGLIATGWILLVGYGGSAVTKSWWPLAGAVAAGAVQWLVWEWGIRNPHGLTSGMADPQNLGYKGLGIANVSG